MSYLWNCCSGLCGSSEDNVSETAFQLDQFIAASVLRLNVLIAIVSDLLFAT